MDFYDKDGNQVFVGDIVRPDEGRTCIIISLSYISEMEDLVMVGQQMADPAAFGLITRENMASQWHKVPADDPDIQL